MLTDWSPTNLKYFSSFQSLCYNFRFNDLSLMAVKTFLV